MCATELAVYFHLSMCDHEVIQCTNTLVSCYMYESGESTGRTMTDEVFTVRSVR